MGYPHEQPFYQPARRQEDTLSKPKDLYTEKDVYIADMIGRAVMRLDDPDKHALREYYGAYPNAPTERKERLHLLRRKLNRKTVSSCYPVIDKARKYVEGYVEGFITGQL